MIKVLKLTIKNIDLFFRKKKLKNKVIFHIGCKFDKSCSFGGYNAIGINSELNNCIIDRGSYIGKNNCLSSIKIGKFCSIGSFVINTLGRHPTTTFVSTHPAFFSKGKAAGFTFMSKTKFDETKILENNYLVIIGNDVWIGDNVTILDGIRIGDGAIVGAGSVITKDIEPYSINVGVPAKQIKKRFSDEQIEFLNDFCWWDNDWTFINQNSNLFENIDHFMGNFKK